MTRTLIAALLAALVGTFALQRSALLHPILYQFDAGGLEAIDIWFDADLPIAACMMEFRGAPQHAKTTEHPLLSAALFVPAAAARSLAGADRIGSFRWTAALYSAVWMFAYASVLLATGLPVIDTVVFSLVAATSAAAMFWTPVPESFVLGGATQLLPLYVAARASAGDAAWLTRMSLAGAVSLGISVSNWVFGIAAAFVLRSRREAMRSTALGAALVVLLWMTQAIWFSHARLPFSGDWLLGFFGRSRPIDALSVLLAQSIVMPPIGTIAGDLWEPLSVQRVWSAAGTSGAVALIGWAILLLLGTKELLTTTRLRSFRIVLGIGLFSQLALHLVFGKETFLYAMHYAPLLVIVAAFAAMGRYRFVALALALLVSVTGGVNNWIQFQRSAAYVADFARAAEARGAQFVASPECRD